MNRPSMALLAVAVTAAAGLSSRDAMAVRAALLPEKSRQRYEKRNGGKNSAAQAPFTQYRGRVKIKNRRNQK